MAQNAMTQMQTVEILIVGGGPAGLAVASRLPQGMDAVVVHQDREIGKPVRTSGGCWLKDVDRLGLPKHLAHIVRHADIYSDTQYLALDMSSNPVAVLDVTGTYRWLAAQARAEILCNAKFLSATRKNGGFLSRIRIGGVEQSIRSRFIVDASGWHCAVLESLGLGQSPDRRGIGIEYEFAAPTHDPGRAALFFGSATPTGYGWAFPTTNATLRLGVGVIHPDTDASPKDVMARLLGSGMLSRMGLPEPVDYHVNAGVLPSVTYSSRLIFDGVIRVGDSANMATPTLGEGIRICIEQGRALGDALGQRTDVALQAWERAARRKLDLQYRIGFLANQRAAGYTPQDWDRSVARMATLPPEELLAFFRNDFSTATLARRGAQALGRKIARAVMGHR